LTLTGTLTVNSVNLLIRAAHDGVGIAYMIESYVAADIAAGRLTPLLVDWSLVHHSYYLYYSGRGQLPAPLQVFTAFLRQQRTRYTAPPEVVNDGREK
jgi:DNA-binding transcriptional LysR family regulator